MRVSKEKLMQDFITCDKCGYNNKKERFEAFGTCLGCGKILDERVYFKAQLIRKSINKARIKGKHTTIRNLIF